MSNMVSPIVLNKIFFKNYRAINVENTIKLMYRALRLYEAREFVSTILKVIVEVDAAMMESCAIYRIMQDDSSNQLHEQHKASIDNLIHLISRGLLLIDSFKEQNRIYNQSFCFRQAEHTDTLLNLVKVIAGYCQKKKLPVPTIEEYGHISYDTNENKAENKEAYEVWFKDSIKATGKLELPGLDVFEKPVAAKVSRIEKALASVPTPRPVPERRRPQ